MPMSNAEIAESFREMADLLEISGANPFRVRALLPLRHKTSTGSS